MKIKALAFFFSIAFALVVTEIGLRVLGPFKRSGKTPDHVLWEPDATIGFAPAARLNVRFYSAEWENQITTDEFGFRIRAPTIERRKQEVNTMLFLGDSQTMGIQVPIESTYVSLVSEEETHRGLRWQVINAGCNGFNTVQEYLFFYKLYKQGFRPNIVVVYATNNDLYEDVPGLPYGRYQIDGNGTIVLLPPDVDSINRLRKAKESQESSPNILLKYSALARHAWYSYRSYRSTDDVAGWVKNAYIDDRLDPLAPERWKTAGAALRSLRGLVSSYGGKLILAVHPDPVEWSDDYYAKLVRLVPELASRIDRMKLQHGYRRVADTVGVRFVNMLKDFPKISVSDFRFPMDPHANISGHRIISLQLMKGFDELGLFN